MNELLILLADVPPTLSAAWAVWFGAGVLLMVWFRRAKVDLELQQATVSRDLSRAKSGPRPSAVRRPQPPDLPLSFDAAPPIVAAAKAKPAPVVVGDPFGDLATLLDQPAADAQRAFRTPGESPIVNSAGAPLPSVNDPFKY